MRWNELSKGIYSEEDCRATNSVFVVRQRPPHRSVARQSPPSPDFLTFFSFYLLQGYFREAVFEKIDKNRAPRMKI
ncbi:hypothetical protein LguiB_005837 [Lonicera macranthoides]